MDKYANSEPVRKVRKMPGKSSRQKYQLRLVESRQISYAEAVDNARLIPKSMVAEFKILSWPDE